MGKIFFYVTDAAKIASEFVVVSAGLHQDRLSPIRTSSVLRKPWGLRPMHYATIKMVK